MGKRFGVVALSIQQQRELRLRQPVRSIELYGAAEFLNRAFDIAGPGLGQREVEVPLGICRRFVRFATPVGNVQSSTILQESGAIETFRRGGELRIDAQRLLVGVNGFIDTPGLL